MVFPFLCWRLPGKAGHYLGRAVLIVARSAPEYTVAYVLPQRLGLSMLPAIIAVVRKQNAASIQTQALPEFGKIDVQAKG